MARICPNRDNIKTDGEAGKRKTDTVHPHSSLSEICNNCRLPFLIGFRMPIVNVNSVSETTGIFFLSFKPM